MAVRLPKGLFLPSERDRSGRRLENRPGTCGGGLRPWSSGIPLASCSSLFKVGQIEELEAPVALDSAVDEDHVVN